MTAADRRAERLLATAKRLRAQALEGCVWFPAFRRLSQREITRIMHRASVLEWRALGSPEVAA